MAISIGKLNVLMTLSAGQFLSGVKGVASAASGLGASIKGMAGALAALNPLKSLVGKLALATGAIVGFRSAFDALKQSISSAAEFEQIGIAFEVMLGSAEQAKKTLGEIKDFAIKTPFESEELIKASRVLLAFGTGVDDLMASLKLLGDISAGTQKPIAELAVIFGQIRGTGRLMGQDTLQLVNAGIPIYRELSKVIGKEVTPAMIEAGQINFGHVVAAFNNMTSKGGSFFNLMDRQSTTLAGRWSTLKDNIAFALREIGRTLAEELDLTRWVESLSLFAESFQTQFIPALREGIAFAKEFKDTVASWLSVFDGVTAHPMWITLKVLLKDAVRQAKIAALTLAVLLRVPAGALAVPPVPEIPEIQPAQKRLDAQAEANKAMLAQAAKLNESLQTQIGKFGMSSAESAIYEFQLKAATAAIKGAASASNQQAQSLQAATTAQAQQSQTAAAHLRILQLIPQMATASGSAYAHMADELQSLQQALQSGTSAQLGQAQATALQLRAMEQIPKMTTLSGNLFEDYAQKLQALRQSMRAGIIDRVGGERVKIKLDVEMDDKIADKLKSMFDATRTPLEMFRAQMGEALQMANLFPNMPSLLPRVSAEAFRKLEDAVGTREIKLPPALEKGSKETSKVIVQAMAQGRDTERDRVERALMAGNAIQKRIEESNAKIADALVNVRQM